MQQLTDGVFRLQKARGANAYLVADGERSVVIDTGIRSGAPGLIAELAAARHEVPPVTEIVLTHYDPDHAGSAAALQRHTGARVWLGAADAAILRGETPPPTRTRRAFALRGQADEPSGLAELSDDEETEVVPGLFAVPAPGHTPGHHVVRWRGVVFSGDAVRLSKGRLAQFPGFLISDKEQALATAALIERMRPRLVCPGHGAPGRLDG